MVWRRGGGGGGYKKILAGKGFDGSQGSWKCFRGEEVEEKQSNGCNPQVKYLSPQTLPHIRYSQYDFFESGLLIRFLKGFTPENCVILAKSNWTTINGRGNVVPQSPPEFSYHMRRILKYVLVPAGPLKVRIFL